MKRFVTYLYEYERGMKTKNVGFIRVDIRGNLVNMELSIRKLRIGDEKGVILGLIKQDGLQSLELGEIKVFGGQGDTRLLLSAEQLQDTTVSIDDVVGIGIRFLNDYYIASCWEDDYAEQIARGMYSPWKENPSQVIRVEKEVCSENFNGNIAQEEQQMESEGQIEAAQISADDEVEEEWRQLTDIQETEYTKPNSGKNTSETMLPQYCYRKLDLTNMHILPMQDRHYSSNAFLVHGFWNYGYVVLKTENEGDKKKTWLGVPGIYEKPEAAMALAFGFPLFEAVPPEVATAPLNVEKCFSEKEIRKRNFQRRDETGEIKNQPSKDKLFGCWFVELHI